MTGFVIRPACADDATGIAEIHYAGWKRAYGDFIRPDLLAAKAPELRAPKWREWLAEPGRITLVGIDAAQLLQGFVTGGPVLDHDFTMGDLIAFDCELYILHCRAEIEGRGLGRALIAALASAFKERGAKSLVLWAYRDNAFRGFYERLGGRAVAEGLDDGDPDVAYGWHDLDLLIERCRARATISNP